MLNAGVNNEPKQFIKQIHGVAWMYYTNVFISDNKFKSQFLKISCCCKINITVVFTPNLSGIYHSQSDSSSFDQFNFLSKENLFI